MLHELFKKWRERLSFVFIFTSFFILVDEYVKEGYIFDPRDVVAPSITHEQLFLIFLIAGLFLGMRRRMVFFS
ncbi:MAG: hypothetical protein RMJ06_05255 [Nitrososphaerota archaeon]|nr:hypothetical protein [Nitrososphaerota archaeon]